MILKLLEKLGRHRTILDREGKEPYLERWYLLFKDRKRFPFNFVIHKLCKSDSDELHDHPWPYATIILKGGYLEITPKGKFWRGPGYITIRRADSLHRLEIESQPCWTLFFMGPKKKNWYFLKNGKLVDHEQYLKERNPDWEELDEF